MKFDIYFHNDFDGRAAAAVMLDFLRRRGDDIAHFAPVNYELKEQWRRADFFERHKLFKGKRYPAIVVDFLYHPKAVFWFDHHPTTFNVFPGAARSFSRKKFRVAGDANLPGFQHWDPKYPSCCRQALEELRRRFGYRPPKHITELAKWLDVIDNARYSSARQAIEMREPALQIDWYIETTRGGAPAAARMVKLLAAMPLANIAARREIKAAIVKGRRDVKRGIALYRRNLEVRGRAAFINLASGKRMRLRFAPYYLRPELSHSVSVFKEGKLFRLSWGSNPWRRPRDGIHIGEFLQQHYGGGGHRVAGGAEFRTRAEGLRAAGDILKYIELHS